MSLNAKAFGLVIKNIVKCFNESLLVTLTSNPKFKNKKINGNKNENEKINKNN